MSRERQMDLTCPKCGNGGTAIMWESLNADINPEAKEKLKSGTIFQYKCQKCNEIFTLSYPILYHDMTHKVMIQFVETEEDIKKTYDMFNQICDVDETFNTMQDSYQMRIVPSQNSLREKAIIFDAGLDDRIIEIIKVYYLAIVMDKEPTMEIQDIFFIITDEDYALEFICKDKNASITFGKDIYQDISNEYCGTIQNEKYKSFEIDFEWARKIVYNK